MATERMSLKDAGKLLGLQPNSVRSRWKSGKIDGERDNAGKIWVFIDPEEAANDKGSIEGSSKPSVEPFESNQIKALEAHLKTVTERLSKADAELDVLRPLATDKARLEAEKAGLEAQIALIKEQRDEYRTEAKDELARLQKLMDDERAEYIAELAKAKRRWWHFSKAG